MLLSEALGRAVAEEGNISRVNVYCRPEIREEAAAWFERQYMFRLGAEAARLERDFKHPVIEDPYRSGEDFFALFPEYDPFTVQITDFGFTVYIHELEVRPFNEDDYTPGYGEKAFTDALKDLKARFDYEEGGLGYEGYVNYMLADRHCGELTSYEIKDDPKKRTERKTYDFIGRVLDDMLGRQAGQEPMEGPANYWWCLTDGHPEDGITEKEAEENIRCLYAYRQWIRQDVLESTVREILRLAGKKDPAAEEWLREKQETLSVFHPDLPETGSSCWKLTVKVKDVNGRQYTYREDAGEEGEVRALPVLEAPEKGETLFSFFCDLLYNQVVNSGIDMQYAGSGDVKLLPEDDPETKGIRKYTRRVLGKREKFICRLENEIGSLECVAGIKVMNSWTAKGAAVDPLERTDAALRREAERLLGAPRTREDDWRKEFIRYLKTPAAGRGGAVFAKDFRDVRYRFGGDPKQLAEELIYAETLPRETSGREYFEIRPQTGEVVQYAVYDLKVSE